MTGWLDKPLILPCALLFINLCCTSVCGAETANAQVQTGTPNEPNSAPNSLVFSELETMFNADQLRVARQQDPQYALAANAKQRQADRLAGMTQRQRVFELLANNQITSATGKAYAAIILQHTPKMGDSHAGSPANGQDQGYASTSAENHLLSYYLNKSAYEMGFADAGWYAGAAMDRYLLSQGLRQKYGTHWRLDANGTRYVMDPLDPSTTDDERAALGIDPLKTILGFIEQDNQKLGTAQH